MGINVTQFAGDVLRGLGAPVNHANIASIVGWAKAEGGANHNNPLNTTEGAPGASTFNGVGVKTYPNYQTAVNATLRTLKNGNYGGIIQAFHKSDPNAVAAAIGSSPWGTSGSLVSQTIHSALGGQYPISQPSITGPKAAGTSGNGGTTTKTTTTPASTDWTSAGIAAFMKAAKSQVKFGSSADSIGKLPKLNSGSLLSNLSYYGSQDTTPASTKTVKIPASRANQPIMNQGSSGYVDPLGRARGVTQGRTDMGIDYTMAPGSEIDAMGTGKIIAIIPNWYKGQPLVEEQLTQGPHKGEDIYTAEQIIPTVHKGQNVRVGQKIATYAPSGTGIEMGLGSANGRTLAQATTGYHEGEVTPAGKQYAALIKSLKKLKH